MSRLNRMMVIAPLAILSVVWALSATPVLAQDKADTTHAAGAAVQTADKPDTTRTAGQAANKPDSTPKPPPPPGEKKVVSEPVKTSDTTKPVTKSPEPPKKPADSARAAKALERHKAAAADTTKSAAKAGDKPTPEAAAVDPKAPYKSVTFAKGEKPHVIMETSMGKIVLELWPETAPKHCQSFVYLVNKGFYDSVTFHRVAPGFVIQGGDPQGNGSGGPGYTIPSEFSQTLLHDDGILSMARTPDPNSAGSQFFICLSREKTKSLDKQYTIFGKVIEGLDVVHKIEKAPLQGERPTPPVYMTKVTMEKKD